MWTSLGRCFLSNSCHDSLSAMPGLSHSAYPFKVPERHTHSDTQTYTHARTHMAIPNVGGLDGIGCSDGGVGGGVWKRERERKRAGSDFWFHSAVLFSFFSHTWKWTPLDCFLISLPRYSQHSKYRVSYFQVHTLPQHAACYFSTKVQYKKQCTHSERICTISTLTNCMYSKEKFLICSLMLDERESTIPGTAAQ